MKPWDFEAYQRSQIYEARRIIDDLQRQYYAMLASDYDNTQHRYILISNDVYTMFRIYPPLACTYSEATINPVPWSFMGMPFIRLMILQSPDNPARLAMVCAVTVDQFKALERYFIRG